ncbi:MAG: hypothetical protein KDC64_05780, partial [Aequorivita sp.]|nr:hypothetical protein [Aequorivita sp.]
MKLDITLINDLKEIILSSVFKVLGVIAYVIAAWLILKIILIVFKKALNLSKVSVLNEKINE